MNATDAPPRLTNCWPVDRLARMWAGSCCPVAGLSHSIEFDNRRGFAHAFVRLEPALLGWVVAFGAGGIREAHSQIDFSIDQAESGRAGSPARAIDSGQ